MLYILRLLLVLILFLMETTIEDVRVPQVHFGIQNI